MTRIGRAAAHKLIGFMEMVGIAPGGTQKTADHLAVAADALVAGAKVIIPNLQNSKLHIVLTTVLFL